MGQEEEEDEEFPEVAEMAGKYVHDGYQFERYLQAAHYGNAHPDRTHPWVKFKTIAPLEVQLQAMAFFERECDALQREYIRRVDECIGREKREAFLGAFSSKQWQDGRRAREESPGVLAVKASVKALFEWRGERPRIVGDTNVAAEPLLEPEETAQLLTETWDWYDNTIQDYIEQHPGGLEMGSNDLCLHRGLVLHKPFIDGEPYFEMGYINSYSMCVSVPEQFAALADGSKREIAAIVSGELYDFRYRILAFSPFIPGMQSGQLEACVIPSAKEVRVRGQGVYSGIHEYLIYEP